MKTQDKINKIEEIVTKHTGKNPFDSRNEFSRNVMMFCMRKLLNCTPSETAKEFSLTPKAVNKICKQFNGKLNDAQRDVFNKLFREARTIITHNQQKEYLESIQKTNERTKNHLNKIAC